MTYTNARMEGMLESLRPLLERRDRIGYAAARNTRILERELTEYLMRKDELIDELGTPEVGDDGEPTGRKSVRLGTDAGDEYLRRISEYAGIEHGPDLMLVPYEYAIDRLSGRELLGCDWMFYDEGEE